MSTDQLPEPRYEVRSIGGLICVRHIYRDGLNRRCTDFAYTGRVVRYRDTKADAILFAQTLAARDGVAFTNLLNNA